MSATVDDVVVRALTADDLPDLERMEVALFGAAAWSPESLAAEIVGPGRWYVGATVQGELVGYAGLWFDGYDAQVMTVGTDERFQGRGLGRRMLENLLAHARSVGAAVVLLEVRVDNDAAIHLYESLGFERLGKRRAYYQPGNIDAWTMRLDLRGDGAA
ncbi:ribosomal protein S18-alanine N-acetyltransferase [Cellulomonas fengjieae]|uniref:ribosomal protein S18-alanine N-acetyltransferase n=1 Tax=Cellulomonas fengjieae TaxID=2819978 RepID=UPI001AAE5DC2|nr:ribosomal protein S18-alanine N-acetyltransferase [Cellulomonas fengjieae]MBO3101646.1 ribosomal protein S18-alanine N-acetyltransferase [Cellulomonas fengjieae]